MPAYNTAFNHPLLWDPGSGGSPSPIFVRARLSIDRPLLVPEISTGEFIPLRMRIPVPE